MRDMRKYHRSIALLLALLMFCASAASAELRRGDSGDEVYALQELLFESGWLFELPDGSFGKNTEQAVKDYERYAGLAVDGVADDEMLASLQADWYALMVEMGQIEPEEGAPIYGAEYDGDAHPNGETPYFCTYSSVDERASAVSYCESHAKLNALTEELLQTGSVEDAQQAYDLWRGEILSLYELWLNLTQENGKADIVTSRTLYLSAMEAQLRAVCRYYESFQIDPGEAQAIGALVMQLRSQAAWLCAMTSGALAVNESGEEL